MTNRKFHRTIIQVEVLSEEPYEFNGLDDLYYDVTDGHCSGDATVKSTKVLNGKQMARALIRQASSPEFFQINAKGEDIDE